MKRTATNLIFPAFLFLMIIQPIISIPLTAQITVNESSFSTLLNTTIDLEYISYNGGSEVAPLLDQMGEDQTWDLTAFAIDDSIIGTQSFESFTSFEGELGADLADFSEANVLLQSEIEATVDSDSQELDILINSYSILSETVVLELGSVSAELSDPDEILTTIQNTPADTLYKFPLTFGTNWSADHTIEVGQPGFTNSSDVNGTSEVDGWGEIIIGSTTIPVLRVTTIETVGTGGFGFTSIEASFIDESGFEIASVSADYIPFTDNIDPESANLQITLYDNQNNVSSEIASDLPQSIKLNQNFPNPFNPTTQISYQLDIPSEVSLSIYSLTGQKVRTLVSGEFKQAGEYSVPFDASNLASGIYIYRLRAGDQMFTRKMTLLK